MLSCDVCLTTEQREKWLLTLPVEGRDLQKPQEVSAASYWDREQRTLLLTRGVGQDPGPLWHPHLTQEGVLLKGAEAPSLPRCPTWEHCGVGRGQGLEPCAVGYPEEKWWSEQRTALSPGKAFPRLSWCSNWQNEDLAGTSCRKETWNGDVTETNRICWQAQRGWKPSQSKPGCCTFAA